jgi:hypothetical protein
MNEARNVIYTNLNKIIDGKLKPWKMSEVQELNIPDGARKIPIYIGQNNQRCVLPTKKQIGKATGGNRVTVDRRLQSLLDIDVIVKVTIPELANALGAKRIRGVWEYCLPDRFKWLGGYLEKNYMEFSRSSGGTLSLEGKIESFDSPFYERHYISNVLDRNGIPYYAPLNLHVKTR